jgi:hypothetical protein
MKLRMMMCFVIWMCYFRGVRHEMLLFDFWLWCDRANLYVLFSYK